MRSNQGLTRGGRCRNKTNTRYTCVRHVYLFFAFCCFDIKELADPAGTAPPKANQFLYIVRDSHLLAPCKHPFVCKPTNPELKPLTNSFYPALSEISLSGPLSTCPNHPWNRSQTTRDSPYNQSLLKLSKGANSKPAYSALSVPPTETTIRVLAHVFLLLVLPPDWPLCFSRPSRVVRHAMPPVSMDP